jgi:hypothetical protein
MVAEEGFFFEKKNGGFNLPVHSGSTVEGSVGM